MLFPEPFTRQIKNIFHDEAEAFFKAIENQPPVSIRLNPLKTDERNHFSGAEKWNEPVLWSSFGQYLAERPSFTFDPLFHAGCYYVQEASSMFVEKAIEEAVKHTDNEAPLKVLDLCAAPGGKATLATSVLPEGSLLVANELIRTRANILAENLIKWGSPDVVVTQSDPLSFSDMPDFFDIIIADVPCSGEGMFRKDPNSINEWSEDSVKLCASRQRDIIGKCWPALKLGGFLIYSTCTYNTTEDEENILWICDNLGAETVEIPVNEEWGISGAIDNYPGISAYRFYPHKIKGEGFFLALLKKGESHESVKSRIRIEKKQSRQKQTFPEGVKNYIKYPERFDFSFDRTGRIIAFNKYHLPFYCQLQKYLHIIHAGVTIGEFKGKDLLPDVSLALSDSFNRDSVKSYDLNINQAISYLRRETLIMPESCDLGWILMTYKDHPLGWMKNIGSRANNAWPGEWRIRTDNPY
jgi:16S rRNA (cytosine1407-C5)-methyltransferase